LQSNKHYLREPLQRCEDIKAFPHQMEHLADGTYP
jgi:hypothetical protein